MRRVAVLSKVSMPVCHSKLPPPTHSNPTNTCSLNMDIRKCKGSILETTILTGWGGLRLGGGDVMPCESYAAARKLE